MMVTRLTFLLATFLVSGVSQAKPQMVGSWYLTDEADEFEDKRRVIAMALSGKFAFAVRCLAGSYSLGLMRSGGYQAYGTFFVKVRLNDGKIIELLGTALSGGLLELEADDTLRHEMRNATKIAIRVTGADVEDVVFRVNRTSDALAPVYKACS